jgi:hypothetical protein
MTCISCDQRGKLYLIESERNSYHACLLCLKAGMNNLKRMKKRTKDEEWLLSELETLIGKEILHA